MTFPRITGHASGEVEDTSDALPDEAANRKHIRRFALITALCLFGDSMLYVALPVHFAQNGLASLWEVGVVLAANRLIRLPLNPCVGKFYTYVSERTGIRLAAVLAVLTTLSYGFLPNLGWWILVRCLWGLSWTLIRLGSMFCILKISTPATRGQYNGLFTGLYRLGSLVGMLAGGLLADLFGLRFCAIFFALVSACALCPFLLRLPPPQTGTAQTSLRAGVAHGLRQGLKKGKTFWTMISGVMVALTVQGFIASTLSHLIAVHTGGAVDLGGVFLRAATLAGLFQALRWGWEPWLAPLVGRCADNYGWPRLFLAALGGGALVYGVIALSLPLPLWFACLLIMQISATIMTTLTETGAADIAADAGKDGRSLLMAYAFLVDLGASLGPLLAYGINARLGINPVFILGAVIFLALALTGLSVTAKK